MSQRKAGAPEGEQQKQLSKELEETFPASDPSASTYTGSGITRSRGCQAGTARVGTNQMSKDSFEDAAGKNQSAVGNVEDFDF